MTANTTDVRLVTKLMISIGKESCQLTYPKVKLVGEKFTKN